jgi:SAM-dependent methyltransferase
MPALDYDRIAALYDTFCVFADDLEYFSAAATSAGGPVLELMAGTGRVSLPLAATGARVVGVDASPAMLAQLARKARSAPARPQAVCADVRDLPFGSVFSLAMLPFQGFTELLTEADQQRMLAAVHSALRPGGRFLCTSHNPTVRGKSMDGTWRRLGVFTTADGSSLHLSLRTALTSDQRDARGQQRIELFDVAGELAEVIVLDLEFTLTPAARLTELARAAGFACAGLHGDYRGSPFDEASSPVIIARLEKPA